MFQISKLLNDINIAIFSSFRLGVSLQHVFESHFCHKKTRYAN